MKLENKDKSTISSELKKEHKSFTDGNWYADEMFKASESLTNKYDANFQDKLLELDECGIADEEKTELVNERNDLRDKLKVMTASLGTYEWTFKHSQVIDDLAWAIDVWENEMIRAIGDIEETQRVQDKVDQVHSEVEYIQEKKEKNYMNQNADWSYTLTKETNRPKIHEVLGKMIQPWQYWEVDYAGVQEHNPSLYKRMVAAIWSEKCMITYGEDAKGNKNTFVLINAQTQEKLSQRALIREWLKLTPWAVMQWNARKALSKGEREENLNDEKKMSAEIIKDNSLREEEINLAKDKNIWWELYAKLLEASKSDESIYNDFFVKTSQRLDDIVQSYLPLGYELQVEPVSKDGNYSALMEVHLIRDGSETTIFIWNNKADLWNNKLYDILDVNEWDYKQYLTALLQKKWSEAESTLAPRKRLVKELTSEQMKEMLSPDQKEKATYGLQNLKKIVKSLRVETGATWLDDDQELVVLLHNIQDIQFTIDQWVTTEQLSDMMDWLWELCRTYINWDMGIPQSWFSSLSQTKMSLNELMSADRGRQIEILRNFGESQSIWSNTHTSYIAEDIIALDDFEISEREYNDCLVAIGKNLTLWESDMPLLDDNPKKLLIDSFYATRDGKWVFNLLLENNMLPEWATFEDDDINELCTELFTWFQEKEESINSCEIGVEEQLQSYKKQKNVILAKDNPSEEELALVSYIGIIEEHPEEILWIASKESIELTKYWGVDMLVKSSVVPRAAKSAWDTSNEIFDDIKGVGRWYEFWNLSDENAVKTQAFVTALAEEIAIMVVVAALVASWVGAPAWAALMAWRVARWWSRARKVVSLARPSKYIQKMRQLKWVKNLKTPNVVRKIWNSKLVNNKVWRWAWRHVDDFGLAVDRGIVHTMISNTYRWEWDKDFDQHLVSVLKNTWLYFALWVAGTSMKTGSLQKFCSSRWWIKTVEQWGKQVPKLTGKATITQVFAEELIMNPVDIIVDWTLWDWINMQSVYQNLGLWIALWLLPWVKSLIIKDKSIEVNGTAFSLQEANNLVWDLAARKWQEWVYGRDATLDQLQWEKKRLEERLKDETNPKKKEIMKKVIEWFERRIKEHPVKSKERLLEMNQKIYQKRMEKADLESRLRSRLLVEANASKRENIPVNKLNDFNAWDIVVSKNGKKWIVVWKNLTTKEVLVKYDGWGQLATKVANVKISKKRLKWTKLTVNWKFQEKKRENLPTKKLNDFEVWDVVVSRKGKEWVVVWKNHATNEILVKYDDWGQIATWVLNMKIAEKVGVRKKVAKSPEVKNLRDKIEKLNEEIKRLEDKARELDAASRRTPDQPYRVEEPPIAQSVVDQRKQEIRVRLQNRYKKEYSLAQKRVTLFGAEDLGPAWEKLVMNNAEWMTRADIKIIQRQVWIVGKWVDGILGPNTLKKIEDYLILRDKALSPLLPNNKIPETPWQLRQLLENIQSYLGKKWEWLKRSVRQSIAGLLLILKLRFWKMKTKNSQLEKDLSKTIDDVDNAEAIEDAFEITWGDVNITQGAENVVRGLSPEDQLKIVKIESEIKLLEKQRRDVFDSRKNKPLSSLMMEAWIKKGHKLSKAWDTSGKYKIIEISNTGVKVFNEKTRDVSQISWTKDFVDWWWRVVNQKSQAKFDTALKNNQKIPSLQSLQNKKTKLEQDLKYLRSELLKIEWNNSPSMNRYFRDNVQKLHGKNLYHDGVKFRARVINQTLHLKKADGNENRTMSSFSELASSGYLMFGPQGANSRTTLSDAEIKDHALLKWLVDGESKHMTERASNKTELQNEIDTKNEELAKVNELYIESKAVDTKNKKIANDAAEITKKINEKKKEIDSIKDWKQTAKKGAIESSPDSKVDEIVKDVTGLVDALESRLLDLEWGARIDERNHFGDMLRDARNNIDEQRISLEWAGTSGEVLDNAQKRIDELTKRYEQPESVLPPAEVNQGSAAVEGEVEIVVSP